MKKLVLMMAGLFLFNAANAQDKEALKAQKAAQKAAESTLKKARSIYETSIPNPQYGRKETDYEKLSGALPLIQEAIKSEYTKDNALAWQTAADIQYQYYLKLENETKADPDNEQKKQEFIDCSYDVLNYCAKYDSLLVLDTKAKPEEIKLRHTQYQNMGVNPAIQLLQAAQNNSNSDKQEDLKLGVKYSEAFLNAMEKSHLMSDFSNQNLNDWKTYAKAFRAQSYYNLTGTPEEKIVAAYKDLMTTKYKGVAYQSLANN